MQFVREHRGALPERGDQPEPLLRLEQGVPGGREEAALGGHEARGEQRRGGVAATREPAAEAVGGGPVDSQPGTRWPSIALVCIFA